MKAILDVCGDGEGGHNCTWKHHKAYNLNKICEKTPTQDKPKFLGMEFCSRPGKRPRIEEPRREICWRHDEERLSRWADVKEPQATWAPRMVARTTGVQLWDATITGRPLCEETSCINVLRKAGAIARRAGRGGWDQAAAPGTWSNEELSIIKSRIAQIAEQNVWRTYSPPAQECEIHAASDASGEIGLGGILYLPDGAVEVVLRDRWIKYPRLMKAHIFLKEYYAALTVLRILCTRFSKAHIYLAIDNTAVVYSLRCLYSSNAEACAFARRIHKLLSKAENTLSVVSVRSEDNGADEPSRDRDLKSEVCARCLRNIVDYIEGKGIVGSGSNQAIPFDGKLRVDEPELLLDDIADLDEMLEEM